MPNLDQVTSFIRAILIIVGGQLTTRGTVSSVLWEQITGVVFIALPIVWGLFVHSDTGKLNAVQAMPEVKKIVVAPTAPDTAAGTAAADTTKPKVVTQ